VEKEDQSAGRTRLLAGVITEETNTFPSVDQDLPGLPIQLFFSPRPDFQAG
jgi:hypothetical protein